ncbi:MAG TPA: glycosyltransferase [Aeromicrobium sp.]|nr:glycosyltransferase [Aeromicrobium sp.]
MVNRLAMLSAHTSPLEQLGGGDAGGMNVYVLETAASLVRRGIGVDIFTKAASEPSTVELESGVRVHSVVPGQLGTSILHAPAPFDLIHSHYWLSGQIGLFARERRGIPLVHSMHTMARVKNLNLATGDRAEPSTRITAEAEIVRSADRLVANTAQERDELIALYGARPDHVDVAHPGVSRRLFAARSKADLRERLGIGAGERVVLFAGRLQPHKGPDIAIEALARLAHDVRLVVVGGPSGSGLEHPEALSELAARRGVADRVTFSPPLGQDRLAEWYGAADVVCVPSHSESFGLVALEAQACGTPVVAAAVGGLTTAVVDGVTGVLVPGHDPADYARAIRTVLDDPELRNTMGAKAAVHAAGFAWETTVGCLIDTYERALARG